MLAESRDLAVRPADTTTSADRLGPAKGTLKMLRFLKRLTLVASFACLTAQNGSAATPNSSVSHTHRCRHQDFYVHRRRPGLGSRPTIATAPLVVRIDQ